MESFFSHKNAMGFRYTVYTFDFEGVSENMSKLSRIKRAYETKRVHPSLRLMKGAGFTCSCVFFGSFKKATNLWVI